MQFFNEMPQQGLESNLITYIVVSSAFGKGRMPKRALQLLMKCRCRDLSPTDHLHHRGA